MPNNFSTLAINDINITVNHFQQNGATCHTTRVNMDFLRKRIPLRLISRYGDFDWPARSPVLAPLGFLLQGYLKKMGYRDHPKILDDLKGAFMEETRNIRPSTTEKVMSGLLHRAQLCLQE